MEFIPISKKSDIDNVDRIDPPLKKRIKSLEPQRVIKDSSSECEVVQQQDSRSALVKEKRLLLLFKDKKRVNSENFEEEVKKVYPEFLKLTFPRRRVKNWCFVHFISKEEADKAYIKLRLDPDVFVRKSDENLEKRKEHQLKKQEKRQKKKEAKQKESISRVRYWI